MNALASLPGVRHAKLSPSSAYRWTVCTAAPREEAGQPDVASKAARDGTVKHLVAARCLIEGGEAVDYLGRCVAFWHRRDADGQLVTGECFLQDLYDKPVDGFDMESVDEARVEAAAAFVQFVRDLVQTTGGELLVETPVPIGHITGEPGAEGTSDVIIVCPEQRRLIVIDLKGGRGKVDAFEVDPADQHTRINLQLGLYGLGALEAVSIFGDEFDTVTLIIVQPALDHVSEITISLDQLAEVRQLIAFAAENTRSNPVYAPSAERCGFCKALGTCPAVTDEVLDAVFDRRAADMLLGTSPRRVSDALLGVVYERLDLIEDWCKAIRSRVFVALEAGLPIVGAKEPYRLAEGRAGSRKWTDADAAERLLRDMHLSDEQTHSRKLISPTQAERLTKASRGGSPAIDKQQWASLQTLIGQSKGRPVIVPVSSSRAQPTELASVDDLDDLG